MNLRPSVTQAVLAAREGREFERRNPDAAAGEALGSQRVRARREAITFMGGPDTIVKKLRVFHDQCGTGVVDLGFQLSGMDHEEVMKEIDLFGREVLPRIKEFSEQRGKGLSRTTSLLDRSKNLD